MAFKCAWARKYFKRVPASNPTTGKVRTPATFPFEVYETVILPVFSLTNVWPGASYILKQYNYAIGQKFSIPTLPTLPVTFCATIRWQDSEVPQRYKLNQNIGELLHVSLYNNQIVNSAFCIEIWNINGATAVNATAVNFNISVLRPNSCTAATYSETAIIPQDGQAQTIPFVYNQSLE